MRMQWTRTVSVTLPPHESSKVGLEPIGVASYNIHRCIGMDGRKDATRICRVLHELDCDLIALQEVDNQPGEHKESMQLDFLAHETGLYAVPGLRIIWHTGEYGNALLTRFKPISVQRHDLSYAWYEPRGALDVELDVYGSCVRVIATHLGLRAKERRFQWRKLLGAIASGPLDVPVIMLGDVNEWYPRSGNLNAVHGVFGEPPAPKEFPTFWPLLSLSRVWVRPRAALLEAAAHRTPLSRTASDHLPIKAVVDPNLLRASPTSELVDLNWEHGILESTQA
jgi:endonuclease/exonuclease/phosphatase family metal-dependent hydrolase